MTRPTIHALRAGHPVDCRCARPYALPARRHRRQATRPGWLAALWPFVRPLIPAGLILAAAAASELVR